MIYLFAAAGFALGFLAGLFTIHLFLKHYTAKDLLKDRSLRWTYGLFVWLCAGLGAWAGTWFYERSIF